MPRTVVSPRLAAGAGGGAAAGADGLPEKLVKYVPAETLAFFVPAAAAIGTKNEGWLIAVIVVALIGTPAYLWQAAPSVPPTAKPRFYFYFLAEIALACWILGTSGPVESWVGITPTLGGIVLGIGAFLIPVTDGVLAKLKP
jgi:hypothetical protein